MQKVYSGKITSRTTPKEKTYSRVPKTPSESSYGRGCEVKSSFTKKSTEK